jgi:prephenate dehydrogenase
MDKSDFNLAGSRIAIFGLGLMGGSLALALRGKCAALYGVDPHPATLELALAQKIVDVAESDPAKLPADVDLIVLSAPVPAILVLLDKMPSHIANVCVVMDLGSTKQLITEAMSKLPEQFEPIGGHPICGKEKLSLTNAERTLYYAAPFILTPLERTTERARSAASQLIEAVGARRVILDAVEHDRILASTSHLPFLLSSAIALSTNKDLAAFMGPGFKSVSRLAGTSSSMMLGVLDSNRENVLHALHDLQGRLTELESALGSEDLSKLESLLKQAQTKYQEFNQ